MTEAVTAAPGTSVVWFEDDACLDVARSGGKGASLAAMTANGMPVPPGFVVPAEVLESSVDVPRLRALVRAGDHARAEELVSRVRPPAGASDAYRRLGGAVAVRSSACAEDSETASFAGQQETYLEVKGAADVERRIVDCWASFFSERALFYRSQKGSLDDLRIAVVVQRMITPRTSGVMFTVDPVQKRRDQMIIEAVAGLGERIVSGVVTPDHYVVTLDGAVKRQAIPNGGVLTEGELRELAQMGRRLEEHFGKPQDIEWALADQLYLLQSRPVTTL